MPGQHPADIAAPRGPTIIPRDIFGAALLLGTAIYGATLAPKIRPPPPEAGGFTVRENPTDPNAPWLCIYGQPWFTPPLLNQYVSPTSMNSLKAARQQRLTKTWHCGGGPNDGRDLRIKHGGVLIFDVIAEAEKLTNSDGDERRRWDFQDGNVVHKSVVIFFDGVVESVAGDGGTIATDEETTIAATAAAPQLFTKTGDTSKFADSSMLKSAQRQGAFLPQGGIITQGSLTATIKFKLPTNVSLTGSGTFASLSRSLDVPADDIAFSVTDDGQHYIWFNLVIEPKGWKSRVASVVVAYKVKPEIVLEKNANGRTVAVFKDPVPDSVAEVTATYRTSIVGDDFQYKLRRGERDQDPIAFDEDESGTSRNTHLAGGELTEGTLVTYSTKVEVDDVVIGIESGPDGFYAIDKHGSFGPIKREIQIRFRETGADSKAATNNDPGTGWVDLKSPKTGGVQFRLEDFLNGTARFFYGIAALYHFTTTGKLDSDTAHYLPRVVAYDVEVMATDPANANNKGTVDTTRFHSSLHFATATEIRRVGYVLPWHSDLTAQIGEDESIDLSALIEVRLGGREMWVPAAGSTYDSATKRPEPGEWKFSQNNVWCGCDHIVNRQTGAGRIYSWADIAGNATKWARTLTAAAHCDANATNRAGEVEVRSQCDIALGEDGARLSLGENLQRILSGSGVLGFWKGHWNFLIDQDDAVVTDPVDGGDFTIDEDEDLDEDAEAQQLGIEEIPTELSIEFRDAEKDDADDSEPILLDDPQPDPRIVRTIRFDAVRRRSQVARVGPRILQQMRRNLWTYTMVGTFGRGLRLLQPEPGDIVKFTSARLGLTNALCRVFVTGWSSDMKPALVLVQHDPAAYAVAWQGPSSAVRPGLRPPPTQAAPTIKVAQLKVTAILGIRGRRRQPVGNA